MPRAVVKTQALPLALLYMVLVHLGVTVWLAELLHVSQLSTVHPQLSETKKKIGLRCRRCLSGPGGFSRWLSFAVQPNLNNNNCRLITLHDGQAPSEFVELAERSGLFASAVGYITSCMCSSYSNIPADVLIPEGTGLCTLQHMFVT